MKILSLQFEMCGDPPSHRSEQDKQVEKDIVDALKREIVRRMMHGMK